jgi:hypothetical protein
MKKDKNIFKKIINGSSAEIISAVVSYPINTLKTNAQIGIKITYRTPSLLFKGVKYSILNEIINGIVFYSVFDTLNKKGPFIQGACSTIGAMCFSHPVYLRRKLAQVGKSTLISNNYDGFGIALLNCVPTVALNFTLKEQIANRLNLGIMSGYLSTALAMVLTHPLDTYTTCMIIKTPVSIIDTLKFKGFGHRFFEKGLTIGTKMMLLDYFNKINS